MKFLQKTWVAWLLAGVMIAAAVGIGLSKGPASNTPAPAPGPGLDEGEPIPTKRARMVRPRNTLLIMSNISLTSITHIASVSAGLMEWTE